MSMKKRMEMNTRVALLMKAYKILHEFSERLRDDEDVVNTAIQRDRQAIVYASARLQRLHGFQQP